MMVRIRATFVLWLCILGFDVWAQEEAVSSEDSSPIDELLLDLDADEQESTEEFLLLDTDDEREQATAPVEGSAEDEVSETDAMKPEGIKVKSSLESLSIAELEAICQERGFALEGDDLQHADYVEAAQRCLSLEDEMNAILAENPSLAAELESEIERMAREKERLEIERDAMIKEKEMLEEKLKNAGIDLAALSAEAESGAATKTLSYDPQSGIEVFRESMIMLFDRVGSDFRLVGKGLRLIVLKPAFRALSFVWRYTAPTVEGALKKTILFSEGVLEIEQLQVAKNIFLKQVRLGSSLLKKYASPLLALARSSVSKALDSLIEQEPVQKIATILGAFFGPLFDHLFDGWRSIKPDLVNAQTNVTAWASRLLNESHVRTN